MRLSRRIRWASGIAVSTLFVIGIANPIVAQVQGANSAPGVAALTPSGERTGGDALVQGAAGNALIDDSLVFHPIVPCRVFDSRIAAAGAIGDNATRNVDVYGPEIPSQGGIDCGLQPARAHPHSSRIPPASHSTALSSIRHEAFRHSE